MPVDYKMDRHKLDPLLSQLNGLYIPGDTKLSFTNEDYTAQLAHVLSWMQDHNLDDSQHFPLIANSWGFMGLMKSQLRGGNRLIDLPDAMVNEGLQLNLNLLPSETFIYDEFEGKHIEKLFDAVTFYNELDIGLTLEDFTLTRELKHFVPVATFDAGEDVMREEEIVAIAEGTYLPIFCFAHRIDKAQFGFHTANGEGMAKVDHSKKAI